MITPPLIREIQRLAEEMHYETQERFITRIVDECVKYNEIKSVEVFLRKTPVFGSSGELGVRLQIGMPHLRNMRTGEWHPQFPLSEKPVVQFHAVPHIDLSPL